MALNKRLTSLHRSYKMINGKAPKYVGIIPYSNNKKGEKYILLSRESFGKDTGLWSGFGGKPEKNESIITTAARETSEESMELFGDAHSLEKIIDKYAKRVDLEKSVYFCLPILYDEKIPEKFMKTRKKLINKLGKSAAADYSPLLEKDQAKWMPIHTLHNLTNLRPKFSKDLRVLQNVINGQK